MPDYSRYKPETLKKMLEKAEEKYDRETRKESLTWGMGMRRSKLPTLSTWEKARDRVYEIKAEIERRRQNGTW